MLRPEVMGHRHIILAHWNFSAPPENPTRNIRIQDVEKTMVSSRHKGGPHHEQAVSY